MACPYGAIYMDPETNTADKCTFCAHRVEGGLEPACVVACPVEANIFGDIDDENSRISRYIMEHQGGVQVRKPEKHTNPKHFYVGGGNNSLNPLAHKRIEGYGLFNNITHLDHIGDPNHSIIDRFISPAGHNHKLDNKSFIDLDNKKEGGH
jgi:hypothetical protein